MFGYKYTQRMFETKSGKTNAISYHDQTDRDKLKLININNL